MSTVFCTVCNGQKFVSEAAYRQHARDSATHHAREKQREVLARQQEMQAKQQALAKQQVLAKQQEVLAKRQEVLAKQQGLVRCTVCNGRVFKNALAYSDHVRDSPDHKKGAERAQTQTAPVVLSSRLVVTPLPAPVPPPKPVTPVFQYVPQASRLSEIRVQSPKVSLNVLYGVRKACS
jgi:uncharacterized C2H2 Zn-finger protein